MLWSDYIKEVKRTSSEHLSPLNQAPALQMASLGLAGESGEVTDLVKKLVYHKHPHDKEEFRKELGDVLWYWTAMCLSLGLEPNEVMEANAEKLRERYPNGFESERSINR